MNVMLDYPKCHVSVGQGLFTLPHKYIYTALLIIFKHDTTL